MEWSEWLRAGSQIFGREVSFGYAPGGATGVFEVPPRFAKVNGWI